MIPMNLSVFNNISNSISLVFGLSNGKNKTLEVVSSSLSLFLFISFYRQINQEMNLGIGRFSKKENDS